jgi:hypothetical protein
VTLTKTNTKTVSQVDISAETLEKIVKWEKLLLGGLGLDDHAIRRAYYSDPEYLALKGVTLKLLGEMIEDRLAHPDKFNDNYAMVMKARLADCAVENTGRLISSCLISILRDPAWLAQVRAEVDAWDGQDIMAISRMTTIKATIMESQRFNPLVVYNSRQATRDFEYRGYKFPAGTRLRHMQVICHFLEEFFPDPLTFNPRRFIEDGKFAPRTNAFFGGGTHICLGRNHTMLQTPIALAQMLKYYDFEVAPELLEQSFLPVGASLKDLWVKVTPRNV